MRVGSDYVIPLDIRIISASNTNLSQDVEQGRFRRDLFFRLNTFQILIPPMRERKKDIVPLFNYYYREFSGYDPELSPEFIQDLQRHDWLGNVRELRSVALRYHAFDGDNSRNDILDLTSSMPKGTSSEPMAQDQRKARTGEENPIPSIHLDEDEAVSLSDLSKVVEELVIESLQGQGLTKSQIAQKLGISRQALYKKLKKSEEND